VNIDAFVFFNGEEIFGNHENILGLIGLKKGTKASANLREGHIAIFDFNGQDGLIIFWVVSSNYPYLSDHQVILVGLI
jgi:hypothetical protein